MKIKDIILYIKGIVKEHDYELFFGTKNNYQGKKQIADKTVIIEPFEIPLKRKEACKISTNFTVWFLNRRSLQDTHLSREPEIMSDFIDDFRDEVYDLIKGWMDSDYLLINKKPETIKLEYFESNSTTTTNTESVFKTTFPVTIYKIPTQTLEE